MKNGFKNKRQFVVAAALLCLTVITLSWQTDNNKQKRPGNNEQYTGADTTEPKQRNNNQDEPSLKDFDDVMKELDVQMQHLNLDMQQLNKQLKEQLSQIDAEKISRQVAEELKKVDFDEIRNTVDKSLRVAQEQVKNINMDKLKLQMEDLQQKINSKDFQKQIDDAMRKATEGIERAKKEMQDLKDFTDQLQKEGLIDKKKGYSIEWKNGGDLYINGKKQPAEVSERYKKFYKKDGWRIEVNGDKTEFL